MNLLPLKEMIDQAVVSIIYDSNYITSEGVYVTSNLVFLRKELLKIKDLPGISDDISELQNSWLFEHTSDQLKLPTATDSFLKSAILRLKFKLQALQSLVKIEESNLGKPDFMLTVKIPVLSGFGEMEKIASDLQKAIETPIIHDEIGGELKIVSATEGSLIFFILVGTHYAVSLISKICWSAAVVRKKNAEASIFEQHARTMEIKNDAMSAISEAIKMQYKNVLDREAEAIVTKQYNSNDPELIERIKLSISTMAYLMDKGVQVLPASDKTVKDESINFPDYKQLNIIESSIKQLEPGDGPSA